MHLDSVETANSFAAAAIRSMTEANLPHSPRNFTVWYDYHSGRAPELARLINTYLSNRRQIDQTTINTLYERFYGHSKEYDTIQETSYRMQESLQQVLGMIGTASDDALRFGAAMRTASGHFAAGRGTLAELIQSLMSEAKDVAERSNRLGVQLRETTEKVKSLEKNLEDARNEAITDSLTGLANRRHFDSMLQKVAGKAMNAGTDVALLLVDIDHFKSVNDNWGHQVGDQVLQLVSKTIRDQIRSMDLAARYGGEEFAVVLPETSLHVACDVGNRIRMAFEGRPIVARGSKQTIGKITVSLGAACYEPGEPLAEWVRRTDAALYEAKATGRNRLVAAQPLAVVGC
jgi:diguanylate cyclase